ncbi:unnamed protein product [Macrosiphum euphorbiae]|uniref:FLYWCH-type domain-containing protein n=1 Tax=Macrosiphum euphorbiae TaxID=13131 RepID=A0AAV0W1G2_9HEMI|nr:unnamed protein product [Macrosiphum euphorbiae]
MSLVYVNSEKNKRMLEYKGFLHTQEKIYNEKVYWKCSESKKNKCKGRVHVVNENIVKFIKHNNHVPNASKIEVKKAVSHLKEISSQSTLSTHAVIGEISSQLPSALAADMPNVQTLKRTIQRLCQREEASPPNPNNFDFIIPEQYRNTSDGELFLHYDSGINLPHILIYTTQKNLDFMENCEHWFCDGT